MTSTATDFAPQELRTTGGGVFAYFVPAAEMDRMRAEIESLKAEVARVTRQRDFYIAELTDLLKTSIPLPPSEQEWREARAANSDGLAGLLAELDAGGSAK